MTIIKEPKPRFLTPEWWRALSPEDRRNYIRTVAIVAAPTMAVIAAALITRESSREEQIATPASVTAPAAGLRASEGEVSTVSVRQAPSTTALAPHQPSSSESTN